MRMSTVFLLAFAAFGLAAAPPPSPSLSLAPDSQVIESLSLNDVPIKDVARLFTQTTNCHVVAGEEAAQRRVSVYLRDMPAKEALNIVCRSVDLYPAEIGDNVFFIQTRDGLKNSLQMYNDQQCESLTVMYPPVEEIGEALQALLLDRVVWMPPEDNAAGKYDKIKGALKRMDLIGKRGTFDVGEKDDENDDDENDDDDGKNRPYTLKEMLQGHEEGKGSELAGKRADAALRQVKMGMKLSELRDQCQKTLPGVVYLSALPDSNTLLLRSGDPKSLAQVKELVKELDKPIPQVLLEVKVFTVDLEDNNSRGFDALFDSGNFSGGFANGIPTSTGGQVIGSPGANLVPQGTGIDQNAGLLQYATNDFKARMQMLQENDKLTRLATPNLLVANNEASKIFVGQEVTVLEKAEQTTTYVGNAESGFIPNTSWDIEAPRRDIGVTLVITPRIHQDRTVSVRLLQEHSVLGDERKIVFSGGQSSSSSDDDDEANAVATLLTNDSEDKYFLSQDISEQSLTTTIVAKDRQTVVIGGLIEERMEKEFNAVPVLSSIPIFGELLFKRMEEKRVRAELLVVIRPFVLSAPNEAEAVSVDFMERLSQHPSASKDLPSMGVTYPWEILKPSRFNPNDPWLLRLRKKVHTWEVEAENDPAVNRLLVKEETESEAGKSQTLTKEIEESVDVQKQQPAKPN